jgi:hypothetical protein
VAKWSDQRPILPIFDFETQKWSGLPINGNAEFPSFSRDNRYVYFLRFGRDQGVFRIPVNGGNEERIADLTQWHITGNFGFSMSLDPNDTPLVLRDIGSDDIYALTLEEKYAINEGHLSSSTRRERNAQYTPAHAFGADAPN